MFPVPMNPIRMCIPLSSTRSPQWHLDEVPSFTLRMSLPVWCSLRGILVVAAPPDAGLVASVRGAVEPLVHAPEAVQSARISGISVVDDTVLERECAHARAFARVRSRVGSAHFCEDDGPFACTLLTLLRLQRRLAPVVVFDARALLLLSERDIEVG